MRHTWIIKECVTIYWITVYETRGPAPIPVTIMGLYMHVKVLLEYMILVNMYGIQALTEKEVLRIIQGE